MRRFMRNWQVWDLEWWKFDVGIRKTKKIRGNFAVWINSQVGSYKSTLGRKQRCVQNRRWQKRSLLQWFNVFICVCGPIWERPEAPASQWEGTWSIIRGLGWTRCEVLNRIKLVNANARSGGVSSVVRRERVRLLMISQNHPVRLAVLLVSWISSNWQVWLIRVLCGQLPTPNHLVLHQF